MDEAVRQLHFPSSSSDLDRARLTVAYTELLHMEIRLLRTRKAAASQEGPAAVSQLEKRLISSLGFNLTADQQKCLDEIRREMKVSPAESQGPVAVEARERARAYLRARQPFVWNATSLTPELRRKSVELFEAYQASVRIVFLETGWEEGLRRNRDRGNEDPAKMVPEGRIEAMLERMTPPERFEAQQVEWRIT